VADRQTRVLGGNLTRTQSFELAPGILQYVQSVLIEVDTTASPATTPLLTIKTQDGVPIADKEQGRTLDGGGSGRATWALRLDDETEPAADPFLPVLSVYARMTGGQVTLNNTNTSIAFTSVKYDNGGWINLGVDATLFTVPTTGYYTVWAQYEWNIAAAAGQRREAAIVLAGDPFLTGFVARENVPTINAIPTSQNVSLSRRLVAGSTLKASVAQGSGGNFTIGSVDFAVTRVWKG
jgi:hypothetical protein